MSSFRKRNVKADRVPPIVGTRTSPQTGQAITSSGNISLDLILGGGLPIGSICLIEEDNFVFHSKVLAKYFLAEGVASKHSIFLGSLDDNPTEFIAKLPDPIEETDEKQEDDAKKRLLGVGDATKDNGLRIAWRYNDLVNVNTKESTSEIGHHFDLLQPMDESYFCDRNPQYYNWPVAASNMHIGGSGLAGDGDAGVCGMGDLGDYSDSETESTHSNENNLNSTEDKPPKANKKDTQSQQQKPLSASQKLAYNASKAKSSGKQFFSNDAYMSLLEHVHSHLKKNKFQLDYFDHLRTLYRVCLTSIGSPQWYDDNFGKDLLKFLTMLRAIVRSANAAVCFITMPMHLIKEYDSTLLPKIRNLVDFSIELESFAGSERETNPAFRKFHGLLHLRKVSAVNTLSPYMPQTTDLAFKLRRKRFVIEKLHLPPELQEKESSGGGDSDEDVDAGFHCGQAKMCM